MPMHSDLDEGGRAGAQAGLTKPATLRQCHEVIETQALQMAQLREQVALLSEQIKLDSRNSSKPPSSDGPGSGNRIQRRARLTAMPSMTSSAPSSARCAGPSADVKCPEET